MQKSMLKKNGEPDGWDIGIADTAGGAAKLHNIIKPYLKNAQDCGTKQGCFTATYKALNGKTNFYVQPKTHSVYSRGVLMNGLQYFVWSAGNGCNRNISKSGSGDLTRICGHIAVDINGNSKPNQAGVDFFWFMLTKNGVIPAGEKDHDPSKFYSVKCEYNNNSPSNGSICTAWVLEKQNMDYLKKNNIMVELKEHTIFHSLQFCMTKYKDIQPI